MEASPFTDMVRGGSQAQLEKSPSGTEEFTQGRRMEDIGGGLMGVGVTLSGLDQGDVAPIIADAASLSPGPGSLSPEYLQSYRYAIKEAMAKLSEGGGTPFGQGESPSTAMRSSKQYGEPDDVDGGTAADHLFSRDSASLSPKGSLQQLSLPVTSTPDRLQAFLAPSDLTDRPFIASPGDEKQAWESSPQPTTQVGSSPRSPNDLLLPSPPLVHPANSTSLVEALDLEGDSGSGSMSMSSTPPAPPEDGGPSASAASFMSDESLENYDMEALSLWSGQAKMEAGTLIGGLPAVPSSVWDDTKEELVRDEVDKEKEVPPVITQPQASAPLSEESFGSDWFAGGRLGTEVGGGGLDEVPQEGGATVEGGVPSTMPWEWGGGKDVASLDVTPGAMTPKSTASSLDDIVGTLGGGGGVASGGMSPLWERVALEAGGDISSESLSEPDLAVLSRLMASDLLQASIGPVTTPAATSMLNMSIDSLVEQPLDEAVAVPRVSWRRGEGVT